MIKSGDGMKKVYISDLHIGDGKGKDDFSFDSELIEFIDQLIDVGCDELIIAGDGLELLNSSVVMSLELSPFVPDTANVSRALLESIVTQHEDVFQAFRRFSKKGRIVYVIGNHDYYLLFDDNLRKQLKEVLGGSERVSVLPYYFDPEMRILTLHGNQFDAVNRLSVDTKSKRILMPFSEYMSRYMFEHFDSNLLRINVPEHILKDYHNVSPILDVFKWFQYIRDFYDLEFDLMDLWNKSFVKMLKTDFSKAWLKANYPYMRVFTGLFVNRYGGMKIGERIVRFVMDIRTVKRTDYLFKSAKKFLGAFRDNGFKSIMDSRYFVGFQELPKVVPSEISGCIMGHNHRSSLRIVHVDGEKKFYANPGTWKPVVEAIDGSNGKAFEKRIELGYVIVEKEGNGFHIEARQVRKLNDVKL
ncbi:MAG: metallophosphoesterase [Kosmotoga sp.]|nr:metallophosphoesterase [Kosmotoga sp.]